MTRPLVLVLDTGKDLCVSRIDKTQKLHVKTVDLHGEMAFRIAYQRATKSFGVITTRLEDSGKESSFFRVMDQYTMQGTIL